jgi:hypothetical protein
LWLEVIENACEILGTFCTQFLIPNLWLEVIEKSLFIYFLTHLLDSSHSQTYTHYQINEVMLTIVYKNVVGHMSLLLLDVD